MTWQLQRNDTGDTLSIPEDMFWQDEFSWSKVAQSAPQRSLTGGLFVFQSLKKGGRPITLEGDWVWHKRGDLLTLRDWTDVPALTMTLTHYDGRTFQVIFRIHDTAIDAQPVYYTTPEQDSEPYTAGINLMTITA